MWKNNNGDLLLNKKKKRKKTISEFVAAKISNTKDKFTNILQLIG